MPKPTLKELRTTYRILSHLDTQVPCDLLIFLSNQIKQLEDQKRTHRLAKMSEEELIRLQSAPRNKLRIELPDGRFIQEKTNQATFFSALLAAGPEQIAMANICHNRHPLIVQLPLQRQVLIGHKRIAPGVFAYRNVPASARKKLLQQIDETLNLCWNIKYL